MAAEYAGWVQTGLVQLVLALTLFALAAFILAQGSRHQASRAFATYLVVRGLGNVAFSATLWPDPEIQTAGWTVLTYTSLASPFAFAWFISVMPRPRGWFGSRAGHGVLAAVAGALLLAVALRTSLFLTLTDEGGRISVDSYGPAELVLGVGTIFAGFAILLLARDATRDPSAEVRASAFLLCVAFGMELAYRMGSDTIIVLGLSRATVVFSQSLASRTLGLLAIVPFTLALFELRRARSIGVPRALAALLLVPFLVAVGIYATGIGATARYATLAGFRLLVPLIAVYALVKFRLFDIDLKLKWTIKRGTLAAVFVAVFFVVAQLAQNYLSTNLGWAVGGIVAGLLLFAINPLQRVAERVANVAMPNVQDSQQYRSTRRVEVYRSAVRLALADSVLTPDEETHLAELATELGLDPTEALAQRRLVEQQLGVTLGGRDAAPAA